jgi:putative oxidoreductase
MVRRSVFKTNLTGTKIALSHPDHLSPGICPFVGKGEEIMAHSISDRGFGTPTAPTRTTAGPAWAFWSEGVRNETLERFGALIGRILLAQIFLVSSADKIMNWSGTLQQMETNFHRFFNWYGAGPGMLSFWDSIMAALLGIAIVFELGGGLSLLLGFKARLGALALFLFLIPTTLIFHSFWTYPEAQQQMQMINFLKNIAIMGGLWLAITFGSGLCSLDALFRKAQRPA